MNYKCIKSILIIVFSVFFLVGCGAKKENSADKNIDNKDEIEIIENQTELSLNALVNVLNDCNDEVGSYEILKMFIVGIENDEINNCEQLFNDINNDNQGRLINIRELVNNGLITNISEEEINNFDQKIICDTFNKNCNILPQ